MGTTTCFGPVYWTSRPTTPHTPQNTQLIVQLLNKSKDNLMMANTQGRNM